ncbi:hypothetical protein ACFV0Z_17820 [Streptomyces xiamenensis]|uniref:hypothetical protein n=1 Tax=Streptomyces xiamenensis TaxID=408015 RepID=UPI0036B8A750
MNDPVFIIRDRENRADDGTVIEFCGVLTHADLSGALRARRWGLVWPFVFYLLLLGAIAAVFQDDLLEGFSNQAVALVDIFVAILVGLTVWRVFHWFLIMLRVRRIRRHGGIHFRIGNSSAEVIEGKASHRFSLHHFPFWVETKRSFVLVSSRSPFSTVLMLPKRLAGGEAGVDRLRALLAETREPLSREGGRRERTAAGEDGGRDGV